MSDWTPDPRFDERPSNRPYPDSMPTFATQHQLPQTDVHLSAFHKAQQAAHEDAVLVEGGEYSRLPQLKRAILETQALQQELGTTPITLTPQSEKYLGMDGPDGVAQ